MAATVFISESNGAVEVVTDNISNMNFGNADVPNVSPVAHPISVASQSYAKWWRVKLQALGGSAMIQNMFVWKLSGAYVTGEVIGSNCVSSVYPSAAIGSYGHAQNAAGGGAVPVPYNANGGTIFGGGTWSSNPVPVAQSATHNVSVANGTLFALTGAGTYSDYVAFALQTTVATPLGAVNQKIFQWQYDEFSIIGMLVPWFAFAVAALGTLIT